MKLKKKGVVIVLFILFGLVACDRPDSINLDLTKNDDKDVIKIGYFHGGRVFVPYRAYVFKEFDKAGLNVDFYSIIGGKEPKELILVPKSALGMKNFRNKQPYFGKFTGREILDFIMDGELDGGTVGESSFIEAAEKGLPIVAVVGLGHDTWETNGKAIIVSKNSEIKEPKDFIGKTIVSPDGGPANSAFLREFFESIGVNPEDVNIIDYIPPNYLYEGLVKGTIDGGYYHLRSAENIVSYGLAEIYQPFNWTNPELSTAVLIFRKDYYDNHQKEIKKFLEVYMDRIKYEKDRPNQKVYLQQGISEKGLRTYQDFEGMAISIVDYPPFINITLLNQMQDLLQKHEQVDYPPVDLSPYVDQSLLLELVKEKGVE